MATRPVWCLGIVAVLLAGCQNSNWSRQPQPQVPSGNTFRSSTNMNTPTGQSNGWNTRTPSAMPTSALPANPQFNPTPSNPGTNNSNLGNPVTPYGSPTPVQIQQSHYNQNPSSALPPLPPDAPPAPSAPSSSTPVKPQSSMDALPRPETPRLPAGLNNNSAPQKPDATIRTSLPPSPTTPSPPFTNPPEPVFPTMSPHPPIP